MAWDAVLTRPGWVQVHTTDGKVFLGKVRLVADPVEVDDLDLYITDVTWVDADGNERPMTGVEGILIARENVSLVQVIPPTPVPATTPGEVAQTTSGSIGRGS